MSDKDLLVVVSEMLKKQDRHSELMQETNETLKNFMGISIKQFEQQQVFNEKFLDRLNSIEKLLLHVVDMEDRIKRLEAAVFK